MQDGGAGGGVGADVAPVWGEGGYGWGPGADCRGVGHGGFEGVGLGMWVGIVDR